MSKRKTEISVAYLRNFAAVVKFGSIAAAADKLGLAASTIWQQIKLLENYFECALVSKQDGLTKATKNGLTLAKYADSMLEVLEHAHLDLKKETQRKTLHVRFERTVPSSLRLGFVEKFLEEFEGSSLNIKHVASLHSIADTPFYNDLDIGLTSKEQAGLHTLGSLELIWACLPENNTLNVAEFNAVYWEPSTPYYDPMKKSLLSNSIVHQECAVVDDIDTMVGMIEMGNGIGLIPRLTAKERGLVEAAFLPENSMEVQLYLKFTNLKINAQFQSSLQRLLTLSNA